MISIYIKNENHEITYLYSLSTITYENNMSQINFAIISEYVHWL
jgi:hypothetical protein